MKDQNVAENVTQTERPDSISAQVGHIEQSLLELSEAVIELSKRLKPVLFTSRMVDEKSEEKAVKESVVSPFSEQLAGYNRKLQDIRLLIVDILNQLDL